MLHKENPLLNQRTQQYAAQPSEGSQTKQKACSVNGERLQVKVLTSVQMQHQCSLLRRKEREMQNEEGYILKLANQEKKRSANKR